MELAIIFYVILKGKVALHFSILVLGDGLFGLLKTTVYVH